MQSAASFKNTYWFDANCKTNRTATTEHTTRNKTMKLKQLVQDRNKY